MLDEIVRCDAPRSLRQVEQPSESFDLSIAGVGTFLDTTPPRRIWLVEHLLPLGCVGLLAAGGGTGKSMATFQLATSLCTGLPWLGLPIERTGSVLILSGEDDGEECHRRLYRIAAHYRDSIAERDRWPYYDELLRERLFILDVVGQDNRLTAKLDGDLIRTPMSDRIIRTAAQMPGPVLIVADPLARFDGGEPNDNSDATRLIELAEKIRKETGATVLLPHHVAKGSLANLQSGQEAVRGASGLVDGARWVGLLQTMRKEHADTYSIDPEDAGLYVRFEVPKSNYARPFAGIWLRRTDDGVLEPVELEERDPKSARDAARGEDRYHETLPKILELVRRKQIEGTPLTRNQLRDYSGAAGLFKVGDQTLRSMIKRAIEEHQLREHQPEGKRYAELHTW